MAVATPSSPGSCMMGTLEELQCLEGHIDRVWQVTWSPSGDMLASCSGDRTVRIWRPAAGGAPPTPPRQPADGEQQQADGQQQAQQQRWVCSAILEDAHSRTVRSAAWSPSGRYLATASFDRTTAIWQHQGGVWENVAVLEGHESEVKEVAWNPNGCLLATCSRDKTVWLWEAAPGNEYEVVDVKHGHSQDVKTVRWHPGGEVLVSASYDDAIKLWVEEDDEWVCAQTLAGAEGHTSTVWEVAFDPQGSRMVSCSDDATLKVWACRKDAGQLRWALLATLSGYHPRTIFSVDWSCSGLIATGGADNAIRVFGEASGSSGSGAADGGAAAASSAAAGVAAAEPSVRGLFMQPQQAQQQEGSGGGGGDEGGADGGGGSGSFRLLCTRGQSHPLDINCVRWHPTDPTLLASSGDDGCIRLWRWHPSAADGMEA